MDLVTAAQPSPVRPHWCSPNGGDVYGVLWVRAQGDLAMRAAVQRLDETAAERKLKVVEVARVPRGPDEAIYARGEPLE